MPFDKHGRRIPEGLQAHVCDADRNFRLNQPKLEARVDYVYRILQLHRGLSVDTGITAEQFKAETERLLALIRDNSQIANIAKGVYLPVVLPKLTTDNLGETLEQYLEAVGKSYVKTFGDRNFCNPHKDTLAGGEFNIVDGSRHEQLVERMKQGPVVGIHFPNPLQGFSINASREQMSTLPPVRRSPQGEGGEGFILSGMDTPIAMVMYPDILARDCNIPGLNMAALLWLYADCSLDFFTINSGLAFDCTDVPADASGSFSGGLLFLG